MEDIFTKADVVMMYVLLVQLVEKGYKMEELFTGNERKIFFEVIKSNEINDEFETAVLIELFDKLLVKSGVRFGTTATLIN